MALQSNGVLVRADSPIKSTNKVAFCITCKGRLEHLKQTLPANLNGNPYALFVVLDYNSKDGLAEWFHNEMADRLRFLRLVYYRFAEPGPFRMAHAKNLAHRLAMREGAGILVNVDADNYVGDGFDKYVLREMSGPDVFLWSRMIKDGANRLPRGISGRIAVTAEQFRIIGGYDERYATWSPDDKDFHQRLLKLEFAGKEIDPRYLQAILHNDRVRFKEYSHAEAAATPEEFELTGRGHVRIVNGGRTGCGVVYRNFSPEPISIDPLPARVFGIGMHKTGTTSLKRALDMVGYPCAHWPSAHWAKNVWSDVSGAGNSALLERHLAACDLPITMLFRELDHAYPGSKFILTVRDERDWLRSVRGHFSPANPFFQDWDHDPWTHRAHLLLYGRKKFDEEVFLKRYRQHNTEVREYFRRRPGDLLEIDLGADHGWHELCGFLRCQIPDAKFPWENATVRSGIHDESRCLD
jgi:hypothetical protein